MLKKISIGIVLFLVLFIGALVAIPFIFKGKINTILKEEVNKKLNAKVDYGDFSFSLLRSFPNLYFNLEDFVVVGKNEFKSDTLTHIPNLYLTVDVKSVINGGPYKFLYLKLVEPNVNAKVSYLGKANWDILKPSPKSSSAGSSDFSLDFKKIIIEKANIIYDDKQGGVYAKLDDLNFEGKGDLTQDIYDLITKTTIASTTVKSGGTTYLSKTKIDAAVDLVVDNKASKYTFKENSVKLNDLVLKFDGFVKTKKDATDLDVKFVAQQTTFKSLLSLVPTIYKTDFDKLKSSGSLAFGGFVRGTYSDKTLPAFDLNLKVNNGMFQYPDLPVAVKNVFINADIAKPQGSLNLMVIDVQKLHLEAGTDPIDAVINVRTPITDPNVNAKINGKMNLANVPKFYPLEGVKTIAGLLQLNMEFRGKQSDMVMKNYSKIYAAGTASVSNLIYDSKETPRALKVSDLRLTFKPENVVLENLVAQIGRTDIRATGTLANFIAYTFGKGSLNGTLDLQSNVFDANEWLAKDPQANIVPDTAKSQFFKVPDHIGFTANSSFGKVYYEDLVLSNVKGQVVVRDEAIYLNDLFANLLGGAATISAVYDTKLKDHPDVSFSYDIKNFDIQQTVKQVGFSEKLAPVMRFIQGEFSSNLKGSGKLNPDMTVDYNSLLGDGKVEIPSARIVNLPILNEINKVAKIPALQNLEIKNGWTVLKFKDGKVAVDPTTIKFGNGYDINFKGKNGFDQSIDYDMQLNVPSKELGPATSLAQGMLAKIPGMNASMPEMVGFVFKVTGSATKPQVKLNKVLAGGSSVKDVAKSAVDDVKNQATNKVDEVKQQAQNAFDQQKKAAEDAARKAKEDAERKAKEAADKIKNDAKNAVKGVFKFPK
jgi:hypothetical protein